MWSRLHCRMLCHRRVCWRLMLPRGLRVMVDYAEDDATKRVGEGLELASTPGPFR